MNPAPMKCEIVLNQNRLNIYLSPCSRYGLMMSCWDKEQEKRPAFSELVTDISTILEGMAGYLELTPFAT